MITDKFSSAIEAENWINGERWKGEKRGLENVRALLRKLGSPHKRMGKVLHVAGTNGKGSVSAFLAGGLAACGYSVGLFISPYLRRFNERIMLNGNPISDDELVFYANRLYAVCCELTGEGIFPTTFELLTALACMYYADAHTDFAVMEVGLGGRLDATNALDTSLSLIAAIGLDHMSVLGDTVEKIAFEKAGIMRSGVPCIVIGIPVRYAHTHYGFSAYSDMENGALLAAEILRALDADVIAAAVGEIITLAELQACAGRVLRLSLLRMQNQ